jgi:hypothetical protein
MFSSPMLMAASAAGGYSITNGLRFRASNSAHLLRSFSASNRKTWTYSAWVKRGALTGANQKLLSVYVASNDNQAFEIQFNTSEQLSVFGWFTAWRVTNRVFRDPTAWLHIVVTVDTTDATANNRVRVYINGVEETSFATLNNPSLNADLGVNQAANHALGREQFSSAFYFDGLMSNVTFVDGQALTPSSFGETNITSGQWVPKRYTGSYGTNGFFLEFKDASAATAAAIGKDSSGNGNNWTPSGISVTAGVTFDQSTDTPTLNYATLNNLVASAANISWANLRSGTTAVQGTVDALLINSYWEVTAAGSAVTAGVISGTGTTNTTTVTANKVFGFRLTTAGALDFINVTDSGSWTSITTGLTGTQFPYGITNAADWNFGQRPFIGAVPGTYLALNTNNLPTPAIPRGDAQFQATLRTGAGATASVTSLAFQPDLVWIKSRSAATNHNLFDSSRGTTKGAVTNGAPAEYTDANSLTAFGSTGYTLGSDVSSRGVNINTNTYVDSSWKKGVTPGFDIVTYTGNATNRTISHALGAVPHFMLFKNLSTANNWPAYHRNMNATPQNGSVYLSLTDAYVVDSSIFNNTAPTSSVFSVGTATNINGNTNSLIAYLWTSIPGFSLFGSYTGNGSADGPFVWCGFKPRWLMIKPASAAESWYLVDSARNTFNVTDSRLVAEGAGAEVAGGMPVDFTASGFKLRTVNGNPSGGTVVFAAFAEAPFKTATAR